MDTLKLREGKYLKVTPKSGIEVGLWVLPHPHYLLASFSNFELGVSVEKRI